jgi:hypothetical protein
MDIKPNGDILQAGEIIDKLAPKQCIFRFKIDFGTVLDKLWKNPQIVHSCETCST